MEYNKKQEFFFTFPHIIHKDMIIIMIHHNIELLLVFVIERN